jgi:hypothetical protein
MATAATTSHEASLGTPISDLGLTIAGTDLESILHEFERELAGKGICRVRPRFYLSTEWGVPFGTVAIAIPFYLARRDLTDLHAQRIGHIEGNSRQDILRYLRHEMGHVVNYAYRLYKEPEWIRLFGDINQAYKEAYRPVPFSPNYVRHLPGWYAQKHPDEDWAETFAVWMTPGRDWQTENAHRPAALSKLTYCDRTMARLVNCEPLITAADLDEDVGELSYSVEQFYNAQPFPPAEFPASLDGALQDIFEDLGRPKDLSPAPRLPASSLIRRLERDLQADIYCWTGHFPEPTRQLLRHLAGRADQLHQVYPQDCELPAIVALTTLVTALAMNHVHYGRYLP